MHNARTLAKKFLMHPARRLRFARKSYPRFLLIPLFTTGAQYTARACNSVHYLRSLSLSPRITQPTACISSPTLHSRMSRRRRRQKLSGNSAVNNSYVPTPSASNAENSLSLTPFFQRPHAATVRSCIRASGVLP